MGIDFSKDHRFSGIERFQNKVWLATPTMHGEELAFVKEAIETNWVSTVGKNLQLLEESAANYLGMNYAVALSCGTAALHMCTKLAAQHLYPGTPEGNFLLGKKVMTVLDRSILGTKAA